SIFSKLQRARKTSIMTMLKLHSAHAQKNGERLIPALRIRITFDIIRRAALRIASAINKMEASGSGPAKRKDARTLNAAKKTTPKIAEKASKDVKYYFVKYSCHHGGRPHKSRTTTRTRPQQSHFPGDPSNKYAYRDAYSALKSTVITLGDLSNMKAHNTKSGPGSDLRAVVDDLCRGIFYQDATMRKT
ncbi:hypothetical protein LSAT2_020313, partial [Lamellibrachia satsuma]